MKLELLEFEATLRTEPVALKRMILVGFANALPQSREEEQQLFDWLKERQDEIPRRLQDGNIYAAVSDHGTQMTVGAAAAEEAAVPPGMSVVIVPGGDYIALRFDKGSIGRFWELFRHAEIQEKYRVDPARTRLEVYNESLQPAGLTEIYLPKRADASRGD